MSSQQALGLVAALMVLTIMVGGLMRRRLPMNRAVRLGLIWAGIILVATVIAMVGQRLIG